MNNYYVYSGALGGIVVYIGKGTGGRCNHLNSGKSHVYEANQNHFKGSDLVEVIKIKEGLSCEEAMSLERQLISTVNPIWNIEHNSQNNSSAKYLRVKQIRDKTSSKYLGVYYNKRGRGKEPNKRHWVAFCQVDRKTHKQIGMFQSELVAAVNRDRYVIENKLNKVLNFPNKDLNIVLLEGL